MRKAAVFACLIILVPAVRLFCENTGFFPARLRVARGNGIHHPVYALAGRMQNSRRAVEGYNPPVKKFAPWSASLNPERYVGFGDSVTAGYTDQTGWTGEGYKYTLQEMLRKRLNPSAEVVLRGKGGERTATGVNRIEEVLAREMPGHILIMLGINDIQAGLSYSAILFNIEQMVEKAKDAGVVPVVGLLPPRDDSYAWNSYTAEFNEHYLRPYLREEGVLTADHWNFFHEQSDWRFYMDPGGQHPNLDGYELMAEAWFVALEPNAPPEGLSARKEGECAVLLWRHNDEYGHAGYNIYRSGEDPDAFEKINAEIVTENFFRDCGRPGRRHSYSVVSVDLNGNESGYSAPVLIDFGSDCFIATAAFGSALSEEVRVLSLIRDDYMGKNAAGRFAVRGYYALSPPLSRFVSRYSPAAAIVRMHLCPIIKTAGIFLN